MAGPPAAGTVPVTLMGRCVFCRRGHRVELALTFAPSRLTGPLPYLGLPGCDCRAGVRCPDPGQGWPVCGNPDCDGHQVSPVVYRPLTVVYAPGVVCGPGNCHGAKSSKCTCSCRGANHGLAWATQPKW